MKRLLAGLFTLITLAIAAVLVAPMLISSDWVRQQVVSEVESRTGLKLALDGDVSIQVFPTLSLKAENVGLDAGVGGEFARVGVFRFGLSVGALINRHIEVTGLSLDKPVIKLAIDASGKPNWLPVAKTEAATDQAAEAAPAGEAAFGLSIARLQITNGEVTWSDARSGAGEKITALSLKTALKSFADPVQLTGALTARGATVSYDVTLATPDLLLRGEAVTVKALLDAREGKVSAEGAVSLNGGWLFKGPISLSSEDPAGLARLAGLEPPPVARATLSTNLAVAPSMIEATNLKFTVDELAGEADIGLNLEGAVPRADVWLRLARLDLDHFMPENDGKPASSGPTVIDLSPLAHFEGGLDLRIASLAGKVLRSQKELKDLHFVSVVRNGSISAVLDPVELGDGRASLSFSAAPSENGAVIKGKLEAKSFTVGTLAGLGGLSLPLDGTFDSALSFASQGTTLEELMSALDAGGNVEIGKASLTGLGLAGVVGDKSADRLDNLSLKADFTSLAKPVAVTARARFLDVPVAVDVSVDPRKILAGGRFPLDVKLASDRLKLTFDGTLSPADLSASGALKLSAPSLSQTLKWLRQPRTGIPDGSLTLSGQIDVSPTKIALSKSSFALDETAVSGSFGVSLGGRTRITASLSGKSLDLGELMAGMSGGKKPKDDDSAEQDRWSEEPLNLAGLSAFDADLDFKVAALKFGRIRTGAIQLGMKLNKGVLSLSMPKMALYKGSGSGKVQFDASGGTPSVSASFKFAKVSMQPFLKAVARTTKLSGNGAVTINIKTKGKSQLDMMENLAGDANINMQKGTLVGVDIAGILGSIGTAISTGLGNNDGASTDFDEFKADFVVKKGIADTKNIRLYNEEFKIRGAGRFNFPTKSIAFIFKSELRGANFGLIDIIGVPIVIEGPWVNPVIHAEMKGKLDRTTLAWTDSDGNLLTGPGPASTPSKPDDKPDARKDQVASIKLPKTDDNGLALPRPKPVSASDKPDKAEKPQKPKKPKPPKPTGLPLNHN